MTQITIVAGLISLCTVAGLTMWFKDADVRRRRAEGERSYRHWMAGQLNRELEEAGLRRIQVAHRLNISSKRLNAYLDGVRAIPNTLVFAMRYLAQEEMSRKSQAALAQIWARGDQASGSSGTKPRLVLHQGGRGTER